MRQSDQATRGNAAILALMIAAAMAVPVDVFLSNMLQTKQSIISARMQTTRNALPDQLTRYALSGTTYRASLLGPSGSSDNQALADCIYGGAVANCKSGVDQPVTLDYPVLTGSTVSYLHLAGAVNKATPAYFDIYGSACTNITDPHCIFQVYSTFNAICPSGKATCSRADSLSVTYTINSRDLGSASFGGAQVAGSRVQSLKSASIPVASILPPMPSVSAQNVTVMSFASAQDMTISAAMAQAFRDNNITDPGQQSAIASAIMKAGVTDNNIMVGMVRAQVTDSAKATAINAAVMSTNCPDWSIVRALAQAQITDMSYVKTMATALLSAPGGFPDQMTPAALAIDGITDSFTINAMTYGWRDTPDDVKGVGLVIAKVTGGNSMYANTLARQDITDPAAGQAMVNAIIASGATNQIASDYVGASRSTNPATVVNLVNTLNAAGLTGADPRDATLAQVLGEQKVTDATLVKEMTAALKASTVDDYWRMTDCISRGFTTLAQIQAWQAIVPAQQPAVADVPLVTTIPGSGTSTTGTPTNDPVTVTLINTCSGTQCKMVSY